MNTIVWDDVDLNQLRRFAAAFVSALFPADLDIEDLPARVVGLVGTLGAGKTRLTQEIAALLGIDAAEVTSPTFTLAQEHSGSFRSSSGKRMAVNLHHVDAYRIADEDEWFEAGMDEQLESSDIESNAKLVVVEWADRFEGLMPPETLWVRIEWGGRISPTTDRSIPRRLHVSGPMLDDATQRARLLPSVQTP